GVHVVLAAMGLRAGRTEHGCGTLAGGELFLVALAAGLLAEPAPPLPILDEPGNNLDMTSLEALPTGLAAFGVAMLVSTHDDRRARRGNGMGCAGISARESGWPQYLSVEVPGCARGGEGVRMCDFDCFGIMNP